MDTHGIHFYYNSDPAVGRNQNWLARTNCMSRVCFIFFSGRYAVV